MTQKIERVGVQWDRIPDSINRITVDDTKGLIFGESAIPVFTVCGDNWAFPNWRDHIGETFKRPKG